MAEIKMENIEELEYTNQITKTAIVKVKKESLSSPFIILKTLSYSIHLEF